MKKTPVLCWSIALLLIPFFARAQYFNEKGNFDLEGENFYFQATVRHDAGDLETAARLYSKATAAEPNHLEAWFNLALVQYDLGHFQNAETALEKLLELTPDDTSAYELYGLILHQRGHFDRAIASYNLVMESRPADALYVNRALAYLETGRSKQALQDFDEALRLNPANFDACLGKGIALTSLQQSLLAATWFDQALALKPGHPVALTNRAIAYFQAGERDRAMEDFRSALAKNRHSSIFTARARCFLAAGNPDEAWHDVREARYLSPDSPELFELLGEIEWERGNHQAAIESFTNALHANPGCNSCYYKRSRIFVQNRRFYEAINDLYRVIEAEPFNREAKALLLKTYSELDRENILSMVTK